MLRGVLLLETFAYNGRTVTDELEKPVAYLVLRGMVVLELFVKRVGEKTEETDKPVMYPVL